MTSATENIVEGRFVYASVPVRWTVEEDGESGESGGNDWVLQVRIIDVSISRRYPTKISQIQAEREARVISPLLLQVADEWVKK